MLARSHPGNINHECQDDFWRSVSTNHDRLGEVFAMGWKSLRNRYSSRNKKCWGSHNWGEKERRLLPDKFWRVQNSVETPSRMWKILVKAAFVRFWNLMLWGFSYYANRAVASSSVTNPISIGSMSCPTSRLGLKGPKKLWSSWSLLARDCRCCATALAE